MWEVAPGRDGPPDAGPRHGLTPQQKVLGSFANGLIAADAAHRGGRPAAGESALSALLRAIDTTLWTVDTFGSLGSEHVAGLVGRPVAVVRVHLELRPPDDVDLSDPARQAEWDAAERELAAVAFPVRLGELTRTDDVLLGSPATSRGRLRSTRCSTPRAAPRRSPSPAAGGPSVRTPPYGARA